MTDEMKSKCSELFVWKYLRNTMGWSEHCTTHAAQKLPANLDEILWEAFLQEAYVVHDHAISAAL
jgi:hypothetical protein